VAKSPAEGGLPPYRLDDLLGRALARALAVDEAICADDIGGVVQGAVVRSGSANAAI